MSSHTIRPIIAALLILAGCSRVQQNQETVPNLLLRDYRPISIHNVPVTGISVARYSAIDMHSHAYPRTQEALAQWVKTKDAAGIEKTIVLTYAHGQRFDSLIAVYGQYPERFELWCGIDYTGYDQAGFGPAAVAELERCHQKGARGIGELGDKGKGLFYCKPPAWGMHPDDARMDPIFRKAAELGMPVNLHVADPKWMYEPMDSTNDGLMNAYKWRLDNQPGIADHAGMIAILENTLRRHPGTTFIACHVANCSYDLDLAGALLDRHPNLYFDFSARFAELTATPRRTRTFFEKYQDRLLYGTDMGSAADMYAFTFRILESADEHIYSPWNSYHWPLHALDLPDNTLEKVYRTNALRLIR